MIPLWLNIADQQKIPSEHFNASSKLNDYIRKKTEDISKVAYTSAKKEK